MTDGQFYLMAAVPTLTTLVGILYNAVMFHALSRRVIRLETKLDNALSRLQQRRVQP